MVTRTIDTTNIKALVVNLETREIETRGITLSGKHTKESADKVLRKRENELDHGLRYVGIDELENNTKLYGMTEDEFIKLSKEITR